MSEVRLIYVSWRGFRPGARGTRGAMAWTIGGKVYVRRGADRWLCGLARLGHELEHIMDPSFDNAAHHAWHHFCLRAFFPIRTWRHAEQATITLARELRNHGWVVLP